VSSLDWLQIVVGFRYCLRRLIIFAARMLAHPQPEQLAGAEPAEAEEF